MAQGIKDAMLSLDISAWIRENREKVEGGFIKKIYQVGEKEFLLKIYRGETRPLYINLDGFILFDERETPDTPSMFAMYLRKRFSNKKILRFEQVNFDRIVMMDTGEYILIFELFGGGNVIVVKDGMIEKAYVEREWRHRTVMRGHEYTPPPSRGHPLERIDKICSDFQDSSKDLVRFLAMEYNLGRYAEEVCARANVNKNTKELSYDECEKVKAALKEIFNFSGCYDYGDFFSPIPLLSREEEPAKHDSMDECLREYVKRIAGEEPKNLKAVSIKEMQLRKIEEFRREEEINRKIGDTIYAHFQEIQEMIERARRGELKAEGRKIKVELDGLEFTLHIDKSPGDNATMYYEKAKKAREKIKGAERAIKEIEEKIKREERERKKKEKKKSRRRFWFEKYRWFISSEGVIVIAGRDVKTNEEVVKKHLGDKDLYMHADIHGAPSVVIKSSGFEVGEQTLREAAQFAVSMSKAWNAGFGNLSAYWVYPSQVSKMGVSGEYVARGAWVIHGKRNYIHNVPLRLAVGKIEYQGTELVMCGPVDAVKARSKDYVVIEPGDEKKESVAKKLAVKFRVTVDEILRILPPGKIRVLTET